MGSIVPRKNRCRTLLLLRAFRFGCSSFHHGARIGSGGSSSGIIADIADGGGGEQRRIVADTAPDIAGPGRRGHRRDCRPYVRNRRHAGHATRAPARERPDPRRRAVVPVSSQRRRYGGWRLQRRVLPELASLLPRISARGGADRERPVPRRRLGVAPGRRDALEGGVGVRPGERGGRRVGVVRGELIRQAVGGSWRNGRHCGRRRRRRVCGSLSSGGGSLGGGLVDLRLYGGG
mmetsp:Transcript_21670/g.52350  ORF Transcript_21670/g.52350 Transcript_21670/m.52350 type:complete len:234 (+) Transcript_21670:822-1523(+)